MGLPVVEPEYGNDCPNCTPAPWASGKTPKKMVIVFDGITACPAAGTAVPPNEAYIINQAIGLPCLFDHITAFYGWAAGGVTTMFYAEKAGERWFSSGVAPGCSFHASNELVACGLPHTWGVGGEAWVTGIAVGANAWAMCDEYNFIPPADTLYDSYFVPDTPDLYEVVKMHNAEFDADIWAKILL